MDLQPGQIVDNESLRNIFKCSPQGGMRRSRATNSLVLITNHIKSIYSDRWIGDILHYTGMGTEGDQSLTFQQNKTLHESPTNGVNLYLFEVFKDKEYTYIGQVKLDEEPYQETQNNRQVFMFPLKLISNNYPIIEQESIESVRHAQIRRINKLNQEELFSIVSNISNPNPTVRTTTVQTYSRSYAISRLRKILANGTCELCNEPAPFNDRNGEPYLESHHIVWLSNGGSDTLENTVALCPNCHKKIHILNSQDDRDVLCNIKSRN